MKFLYPYDGEIRRFAERETDPAVADSFEPITKGPAVAILVLVAVGFAGAVVGPIRILGRLMQKIVR